MGRRAHLRLAAAVPPAGPRLRTQARSPRGHGVLGHHHDHDKAPGQIRNRNSPGQTVGRRPQPSLTETRSTGRMTTFIYRLLADLLGRGGASVRKRRTSSASAIRAASSAAAIRVSGVRVILPPDRVQIATALPRISANGRKSPLTATIPWCAPTIGSRDAPPRSSSGSKAPNSRGGGRAASGSGGPGAADGPAADEAAGLGGAAAGARAGGVD